MKKMPTRLCCSFDITSLFEFSLWFAFLFEFSLWFGHDKQTFGTTISSNFRWLYTSIWSKKLRKRPSSVWSPGHYFGSCGMGVFVSDWFCCFASTGICSWMK
ncbi:uncharacterized protein LOC132306465 isoform X2 [Cornus florida]|uniref:uncharacterized protein LOC132306465 isoform X2 n=1 Tax=Cornus florida TaxID=4283 RepID=UPI00289B086D|nr:uncharacterized protein LOC132306465 isoform X2 [Cornus florida]